MTYCRTLARIYIVPIRTHLFSHINQLISHFIMSFEEIKIVPSQKNKPKICIGGYIFHINRQRDDIFYWKCDACEATAGTKLLGDDHILGYHRQHHAPDPTQTPQAEIRRKIKAIAGTSRDGPSRIIQDVLSQQADAAVFAGSRDSLRQVAKRERHDTTAEPEIQFYSPIIHLFLMNLINN